VLLGGFFLLVLVLLSGSGVQVVSNIRLPRFAIRKFP